MRYVHLYFTCIKRSMISRLEYKKDTVVALFSFFCVLYLVTLRRYVKSVFLGDTAENNPLDGEYVGRLGKVVSAIRPEVPGRVLVGDAEWTAASATSIEAGADVRGVAQENLTMRVERI